jgi:hypothetical protein
MKALIKKEINGFFSGPMGYLVIAIFLVINGLFLWGVQYLRRRICRSFRFFSIGAMGIALSNSRCYHAGV